MDFFITIGNSHKNGTSENNVNHSIDTDEDMGMLLSFFFFFLLYKCIDTKKNIKLIRHYPSTEVDPVVPNRKSSKSGVERMLEFGRELFQMSQRLEKENGANDTNRRMLEVSHFCMRNKCTHIHKFVICIIHFFFCFFRMHLVC